MSTPTGIGRAGEGYVVDWLKAEKYSIKWNTQTPGVTDIEAQTSSKRLLVQVKTALYPNDPDRLSTEEEKTITARAARLGAQAWEARVQVGSKLELIGNVQWRKI